MGRPLSRYMSQAKSYSAGVPVEAGFCYILLPQRNARSLTFGYKKIFLFR
jgi:hypothetical protein